MHCDSILRVGGRLTSSNLSVLNKHSILISLDYNFTFVVIDYYHSLYFHTGLEATLANIRLKFWIPSGRDIVKKYIKELYYLFEVKRLRFATINDKFTICQSEYFRSLQSSGSRFLRAISGKNLPGKM